MEFAPVLNPGLLAWLTDAFVAKFGVQPGTGMLTASAGTARSSDDSDTSVAYASGTCATRTAPLGAAAEHLVSGVGRIPGATGGMPIDCAAEAIFAGAFVDTPIGGTNRAGCGAGIAVAVTQGVDSVTGSSAYANISFGGERAIATPFNGGNKRVGGGDAGGLVFTGSSAMPDARQLPIVIADDLILTLADGTRVTFCTLGTSSACRVATKANETLL